MHGMSATTGESAVPRTRNGPSWHAMGAWVFDSVLDLLTCYAMHWSE